MNNKYPRLRFLTASFLAASLGVPVIYGCDGLINYSDTEHIQRAKEYQANGDVQAAVIELKNALQQNPSNKEGRWLLGDTYVALGEGKEAEKELNRATELGLNPETTRISLGKALLLQGEYKRVLAEIKSGEISSQSNAARILAVRGEAQLALGQLRQAKDSFAQALASQPDLVEAIVGEARVAIAEKNFDGASTLIDRALVKAPQNLTGLMLKGDLLRLLNKEGAALAAYQKAHKYYPQNITAQLNIASIQIATGKYDDARKNIEAVRIRGPNNPMGNYVHALLEFRQGKNAAALEAVQKVLAAAPGHLPSLLLAGAIQYALGSYEQAEHNLRRFLDSNGANPYARKLLAAVLLKATQPARAIEVLEPILKQSAQDVDLLALAGDAYTQTGQFAKATGYLEQAAAIDPRNAGLQTALGASRLALGETDLAIRDLESAIQLDTAKTQADEILVLTYLNRKEYDKALLTAGKLAQRQPNNPVAYNLLGAAYLAKDDKANARQSFEKGLALKTDYFPAAINLAKMDFQDKDLEHGRALFANILAEDSKNLRAMLALAQFEAAAGNMKESIAWLEKARKENPAAVEPRSILVNYYLQAKDPQRALVIASEARTANANQPDVLDMLGRAQLAVGETSSALATYSTLVNLTPKLPLAHFRLAAVQIATNNQRAAIPSLKKALELNPAYLDAAAALAGLEMRNGQYDEVLKQARNIQKQYPQSPIGYTLEGDALIQQKRYPDALKTLQSASDLGKSAMIAIGIDAAKAQGSESKNSHEQLKQWLKDNPNDLASRIFLANAYLQTSQNTPATEQYRLILQQDQNNLLALNNLASVLHERKDPQALEYAERAAKLAPDNANIADTLGWILVERGELPRGMDALKKAVTLAPKNPTYRYHLAAALAKSGETAAARKELDQVLAKGEPFRHAAAAKALREQL